MQILILHLKLSLSSKILFLHKKWREPGIIYELSELLGFRVVNYLINGTRYSI